MVKKRTPRSRKKDVRASATSADAPEQEVKMGRPSCFTPEIAELICQLLAEGKSLVAICKLENMPRVSTVFSWLAKGEGPDGCDPYKSFLDMYARAREAQAELYASEIIDISDDSHDDEIFTDEGKRVCNVEFVQRSKLRVDARKWIASKLLPKKYGEKVHQEITGKDGGPIETHATGITESERVAGIAALLDAARSRAAGQPSESPDKMGAASGPTDAGAGKQS